MQQNQSVLFSEFYFCTKKVKFYAMNGQIGKMSMSPKHKMETKTYGFSTKCTCKYVMAFCGIQAKKQLHQSQQRSTYSSLGQILVGTHEPFGYGRSSQCL